MRSLSIDDVPNLLQPIEGESATGEDVREDPSPSSLYQMIKLERSQARAAERQNIDGDNQQAMSHWLRITELAPEILTKQSKDLEITSWYIEALVRCSGFSGLHAGFALVKGLVDNFWEQLHPMPDEYGMETRVSCLAGLNGEGAEGVLIAPIRRMQLTDSGNEDFAFWQYLQVVDAERTGDEEIRKSKLDNLGFTSDDISKSVAESDDAYFISLRDSIDACITIYREVGLQLDGLCGLDEAPPTKSIIEVLEECLGCVKHLASDKFAVEELAEDDVPAGTDGEAGSGEPGAVPAQKAVSQVKKQVETREEAFKQLQEIAEYFRKTEPHSPVSYAIEKAVKWGKMPLHELIDVLITDNSSRERYSELTGVETNEN